MQRSDRYDVAYYSAVEERYIPPLASLSIMKLALHSLAYRIPGVLIRLFQAMDLGRLGVQVERVGDR